MEPSGRSALLRPRCYISRAGRHSRHFTTLKYLDHFRQLSRCSTPQPCGCAEVRRSSNPCMLIGCGVIGFWEALAFKLHFKLYHYLKLGLVAGGRVTEHWWG